jgi:hypothetical protein
MKCEKKIIKEEKERGEIKISVGHKKVNFCVNRFVLEMRV